MHVLMVADGRSPIFRRMLETIRASGHQVTLLSTFPCSPPADVEKMFVLPVAFSRFASGRSSSATRTTATPGRSRMSALRRLLLTVRYRLGPFSVRNSVRSYRSILRQVEPDLVHALRIPFEGMLAGFTPAEIPLVVSIWGNDLTLHAGKSAGMARLTRLALARADGLHSDTLRDVRLAAQWGFLPEKPHLVVPGNGGIDLDRLQAGLADLPEELAARIPTGRPLVINPRGIRAYTCTGTFFQAIPLVLERCPEAVFLCPGMQGESEAMDWVASLHLDEHVVLLPLLPQAQLWSLFARSLVSVSVTHHDGTPNTLLEAMACGSFPVAGDLDSLREWITPGSNGLLVESSKPQSLAEAILQGLDSEDLRRKAAEANRQLIAEKAAVEQVRPQMEAFYQAVAPVRN